MAPLSMAQWGAALVTTAFALLLIGLAINWRLRGGGEQGASPEGET